MFYQSVVCGIATGIPPDFISRHVRIYSLKLHYSVGCSVCLESHDTCVLSSLKVHVMCVGRAKCDVSESCANNMT